MNKRNKLLTFIMSSFLIFGCAQNGPDNENSTLKLGFEKNDQGYFITLKRFNHQISTIKGSMGVRFDKNEFRADEPIYDNYDSIEEIDGALLAKGEISSKYGTIISFTDSFRINNDRLLVNRNFEVTKVGEDYGFMVEQKWIDEDESRIEDKEWFIPASYYVNGDRTFERSATRMYFGGDNLVIPADCVSSLLAASLKDNFSVAMIDTTSGQRETDISDIYTTSESYLHISENFNMPGINLINEDNKTCFSHLYPTFSNKQQDFFSYKLLPVELGFSRNISYSMFLNKYSSFDEMQKIVWRTTYSQYEYTDKRYTLNEVYQTLLDYVQRSYSDNNAWGNIPQYMTFADHYFPDSGFLYRNIELAMFMFQYGRKIEDQATIDNAIKVIDYQIDNDKVDTKIGAYQRTNSVFKRVLFDGLASVVDLYEYLVTSKFDNDVLKNKLFNYILKKAEIYKNEESLMALSFYTKIYKNQNILHLDYDESALRLINTMIESTKNYDGYYGGVENTNEHISVLEDYMIFLNALFNVYERNNEKKYLNEAIRLADYVETYQFIQPMNLNIKGSTGTEGYNFGFIGNERFLSYGYAFNNSCHYILDACNTSNVIEYFKLYNLTGDKHYLDFAEYKLYNATIYLNMGDKVGHMDDPLHSSGNGFTNEFVGNATRTEGYADGGMRGAVHDSVIAWNVYQLLLPLTYLDSINYEGLNPNSSLTHDLAKNKVISIDEDNVLHSVYNTNNGLDETYYINDEDSSFIYDLNEQCFIENIVVDSDEPLSIALSSNGTDFVNIRDVASINEKARYVKFYVNKDTKVNDIKINGYPVRYVDLSVNSSILSEDQNASHAIDQSNYKTIWNASLSNQEAILILDLNDEHEIYETSIMFGSTSTYSYKIETSIDGVNYIDYGYDDGTVAKYVFVNEKFAKARYVKLTLFSIDATNIQIKDFKVLGS